MSFTLPGDHAAQAAQLLADSFDRCQALDRLKRELTGDIDEMNAKIALVDRRFQADLRMRVETTERLMERLP